MGGGLKEFCLKNETVIYKGLHILILLECGFSECNISELTYIHRSTVYTIDTFFGGRATIMCDKGFYFEGTAQPKSIAVMATTCNASGKWDIIPKCIKKECNGSAIAEMQHAKFSMNDTYYGDQAIVTCDEGYILKSSTQLKDNAVMCNASGEWDNIPLCVKDDSTAIEWGIWGPCSLTCGQGTRLRVSQCFSTAPAKECDSHITEIQICSKTPCKVSVLVLFETIGKMYHESNEHMEAENIPYRIPYWNSEFESYRPNWNGFFTLDSHTLYGHHGPQSSEEWRNLSYGHTVIAPLWTKLDDTASRDGGLEIILLDKYRSNYLNNSEYRDLKILGDLFSSGLNLTNFKPLVALVATWKNVSQWLPLLAPGSHEDKHFSMQVILISDGIQSYLMFNYEPEEWSLQPLSYGPASAGFSMENHTGYIMANNGNFFNLNNRSNLIPPLLGRYIYNVSASNQTITANLQNDTKCLDFNHNLTIRHWIQEMRSKADACPCSETHMKLDFAYHPVPSMYPDLQLTLTCYEAWFFNQAGVKQTCCYR